MQENSLDALLTDNNIEYPTDFPDSSQAPGLRDLDTAIRCNICGEFFDAPVTLPCGHCFCSLCVRRSLSMKAECPACRKPATEGKLRPIPTMEQILLSWKAARPCILDFINKAKAKAAILPTTPAKPPKGAYQPGKKRKRSGGSDRASSPDPLPVAGPSRLNTKRHTTLHRSPNKLSKTHRSRDNTVSDRSSSPVPILDSGEEDVSDQNQGQKEVECPVCQKYVRFSNINRHIDSGCTAFLASMSERQSRAAAWSKVFAPIKKPVGMSDAKEREVEDENQEPLPKVAYTTLKDRQLKDLLTEQSLPTTGDRSTWITRHQQWVMLYNANLDKSINQRKSLPQLRKDLKKWEEERKWKKAEVEDVVKHQKMHKADFDALIQQARPKKASDDVQNVEGSRDASSNPTVSRHFVSDGR